MKIFPNSVSVFLRAGPQGQGARKEKVAAVCLQKHCRQLCVSGCLEKGSMAQNVSKTTPKVMILESPGVQFEGILGASVGSLLQHWGYDFCD